MDFAWKTQNIEKTETSNTLYFGRILQKIRKEAGLTQRELSELSGVSYRAIQDYEREKVIPTLFMAESVLNALGYKLEVVVDDRNE